MRNALILNIVLTAFLFAACAAEDSTTQEPTKDAALQSIAATASANPDFSTLTSALTAANLVDTLNGTDEFTVFAPTNAAFEALDKAALDAALADPSGLLTEILTYHVIEGRIPAATVLGVTSVKSLLGETISVAVVDGGVVLNDTVKVTSTDIECSNGIIHVIDAVLLPPQKVDTPDPAQKDIVDTAVAAGSFKTLVEAVTAAGLVDTLKGQGPFTVFAPTDDAFAALDPTVLKTALDDPSGLLTQVLTYHAVAGKVMAADVVKLTKAKTVNGADITIEVQGNDVILNGNVKVIQTDIECSNGVIHVIDTVLLPPSDTPVVPETKDIVDTAIAAGTFTTLVEAVKAAGLVETLKGDGPFTVFAPTDDAFAAMDQDTLKAALADPKGLLAAVLTYHVLAEKVVAGDIINLTSAVTVNGKSISIEVKDGKVVLDGTFVVSKADIQCSNGVIHVIDGVLLPPSN